MNCDNPSLFFPGIKFCRRSLCLTKHYLSIIVLVLFLYPTAVLSFSANDTLGSATEGLMTNFFEGSGHWKTIPGQTGRQGIDGLFVKRNSNGQVVDVLVAESKYGSSKLGKNLNCGGNQMSKEWIICKLKNLEKSGQISTDDSRQIKQHVRNDNYRGRLWNAKVQNGKLAIVLQDVKSKGNDVKISNLKGGSKYKVQYVSNQNIDLKNPKNQYQRQLANQFFNNIDQNLKEQGVSDSKRKEMVRNYRKNPDKISSGLFSYQKVANSKKSYVNQSITKNKKAAIPTKKISRSISFSAAKKVKQRTSKNFVKKIWTCAENIIIRNSMLRRVF